MNLEKILTYAKTLIKSCTNEGDYVIDATIGNGNDTLFLAKLVKNKGHVFGFDIQEKALYNTKSLLNKNNCNNVTLYKSSHEYITSKIPAKYHGKIASTIFNLGYLPRGDKLITTNKISTLKAVKSILSILKTNGIIVLVVYLGHIEGKLEKEALIDYVKKLDQKKYQVLMYRFINQINDAPFIIAI